MAQKRKKRKAVSADRRLIALSQPHEVRYWSKKFRVSPARLKAAVKVAGRSARKVGAYIKLMKHRARDRMLISTKEAYEVRYWSKKFKVTPVRLKAAVKAAGRSSRKVERLSRCREKEKEEDEEKDGQEEEKTLIRRLGLRRHRQSVVLPRQRHDAARRRQEDDREHRQVDVRQRRLSAIEPRRHSQFA